MKPSRLVPALALASCAGVSGTSGLDVPPEDAPWTQRLVEPLTSPTTFESPVIQSNLEPVVMNQRMPSGSVFSGGDFHVYALQARWAVTDRLAIVATKDGYINFNPDVGMDEDGWADIAGGLKYAIVNNPERGILVTPGLIYESQSGSREVFQGNGNGVLRPFLSAAWDRGAPQFMGAIGYNLPFDTDEESTSIDAHFQFAYQATPVFAPLIELNAITYTRNGRAAPFDFEGGDLINLGSNDVKGNTVVTGALGARFRLRKNLQLGVAYEIPLTSREDLLDDRVTLDAVFSF